MCAAEMALHCYSGFAQMTHYALSRTVTILLNAEDAMPTTAENVRRMRNEV